MKIGSFGKISFKVDEKEIKIFNNLTETKTAKFIQHERIGKKPLLQFNGFNLNELSFQIQLIQGLTGNIESDLKEINYYFSNVLTNSLFIGKKKIGNYVIESYTVNYDMISQAGTFDIVTINLKLKESVD